MGYYVIRAATGSGHDPGDVPLDADTLERWIDCARAAANGDPSAKDALPQLSGYVAERVATAVHYHPIDKVNP